MTKKPKVLFLRANAKVSSERRLLDLESEVLGSILTEGNILLLDFFVFTQ